MRVDPYYRADFDMTVKAHKGEMKKSCHGKKTRLRVFRQTAYPGIPVRRFFDADKGVKLHYTVRVFLGCHESNDALHP